MPKIVEENRVKDSVFGSAVTLVLCLIPIIIIAFVSIGDPNVWAAPYPRYCLYFLAISMYFSLVIGILSPVHWIVWIVLQAITALGTIAFLLVAYILQDALLLHLATSTLFVYMIYFTSRNNNDDVFMRYATPFFCLIAALISVLLFMGVNMSMLAQTIIASVFNVIYLIVTLVSLSHLVKDKSMSEITAKNIKYTEQTEEEKAQEKAQKEKIKLEKYKAQKEKSDLKAEQKRIHDSDPKVAARKERRSAAGRVAKTLLKGLIPWGPPMGSEYWDEYDWLKYFEDKVDSAAVKTKGSLYISGSLVGNYIQITVDFSPYSETTQSEYNACIRNIKDKFRAACKHSPYSAQLVWR